MLVFDLLLYFCFVVCSAIGGGCGVVWFSGRFVCWVFADFACALGCGLFCGCVYFVVAFTFGCCIVGIWVCCYGLVFGVLGVPVFVVCLLFVCFVAWVGYLISLRCGFVNVVVLFCFVAWFWWVC